MTREQKLALLIGFALVLVVGVVVSDHLSGASRAELEAVADSGPAPGVGSALSLPDTSPPLDTTAAAPRRSEPVEIDRPRAIASDRPTRSAGSALKEVLQRGMNGVNDAIDRLSEAPVAAQTDEIPSPGSVRPSTPLPEADGPVEITMGARPESAGPRGPTRRYVVQDGDSLWSIAQEAYGDGSLHVELAEFNEQRVGRGGTVFKGATILLPPKDALLGGAPVERAAARPERAATKTRRYTVQKGDTLGEIASKLLGSAKRWPQIVEMNEDVIDDPDNVPAGVVLTLPAD